MTVKRLLMIVMLLVTGRTGFCENTEHHLYSNLEQDALPYGQHKITEMDITTTYGQGRLIVAKSRYIRHIYYASEAKLWVEFEFNPDEEYALVEMVISRLPFGVKEVAPKKAIRIPATLLRYFAFSRSQIEAVFHDKMWKRDQSVYVPKVNGPILMPARIGNVVHCIEFYFDHHRIAALAIDAP